MSAPRMLAIIRERVCGLTMSTMTCPALPTVREMHHNFPGPRTSDVPPGTMVEQNRLLA